MSRSVPDHEGLQAVDASASPAAADLPQVVAPPSDQKESYTDFAQKEVSQHGRYAPPGAAADWKIPYKADAPGAVPPQYQPPPDARWQGAPLEPGHTNGVARRKWWARKRCFAIVAVLLVILVVVIVVPVVLVGHKSTQTPAAAPSPSVSSSPGVVTGSTTGAFQGTGIGTDVAGDPTVVYFQHYDGPIWQTVANGSDFVGPIIQGDIKNGTPITITSYTKGSDTVRHLAFINSENILQDYLSVNGSGTWNPGHLGAAQVQASSSPNVGLSITAIQVGTTAPHTPGVFPTSSIRLYYGGTDHCIHEMTLLINDTTWHETFTFPKTMNGDASFYAAQPDNYTYVFGTDQNSVLSWYYMQTFPQDVGSWNAGAQSSETVHTNGSISIVSNYMVIYQDQSNAVRGIRFNVADFNAPWGDIEFIDSAVPGTRVAATMVGAKDVPGTLVQDSGDSISWYVQGGSGWSNMSVAVNS